jgi:hypothetical protein
MAIKHKHTTQQAHATFITTTRRTPSHLVAHNARHGRLGLGGVAYQLGDGGTSQDLSTHTTAAQLLRHFLCVPRHIIVHCEQANLGMDERADVWVGRIEFSWSGGCLANWGHVS